MNAWTLSFALLVACDPKGATSASEDETGTLPERTPETDSTPETSQPPTGTTGDTADDPGTTSWTGLYPLVPYDCAQGVPAGPYPVSSVAGVLTTEDFAFDTDGWLVASDWSRNLLRYDAAGQSSIFSPAAAETRGIDLLPDGQVVVTDAEVAQVKRVAPDGTLTTIASVGPSPAGIDVAADGTVYVGDLNFWHVYEVAPDGTATRLAEQGPGNYPQTYGVALSLDEQTLYVSQYNGGQIYRLQKDSSGAWGTPSLWVSLGGFGLAGLAVDACDNLYVVAAFGCQIFRVSPAGDVELIASLDPPGDYCPSLAFGRDVGGWDPLSLYVSTYEVLTRIEIGVPGKPR